MFIVARNAIFVSQWILSEPHHSHCIEREPFQAEPHHRTLSHERARRRKSEDVVSREGVQIFGQIIFQNAVAVLRSADQFARKAALTSTKLQVSQMDDFSSRTGGSCTFDELGSELGGILSFAAASVEGEHSLQPE
jgi:hypothetical protein